MLWLIVHHGRCLSVHTTEERRALATILFAYLQGAGGDSAGVKFRGAYIPAYNAIGSRRRRRDFSSTIRPATCGRIELPIGGRPPIRLHGFAGEP